MSIVLSTTKGGSRRPEQILSFDDEEEGCQTVLEWCKSSVGGEIVGTSGPAAATTFAPLLHTTVKQPSSSSKIVFRWARPAFVVVVCCGSEVPLRPS